MLALHAASMTFSAPPTRPTLLKTFNASVSGYSWATGALNASLSGRFVFSEADAAQLQSQVLPDGRTSKAVLRYNGTTAGPAGFGVFALQPFFDSHVCFVYPLPEGYPGQAESFELALEEAWCQQAAPCMAEYQLSTYSGAHAIAGVPCQLWQYTDPSPSLNDTVSYCVTDEGHVLSVNRSYSQANVQVDSRVSFSDYKATVPASAFAVADEKSCVDLRPRGGERRRRRARQRPRAHRARQRRGGRRVGSGGVGRLRRLHPARRGAAPRALDGGLRPAAAVGGAPRGARRRRAAGGLRRARAVGRAVRVGARGAQPGRLRRLLGILGGRDARGPLLHRVGPAGAAAAAGARARAPAGRGGRRCCRGRLAVRQHLARAAVHPRLRHDRPGLRRRAARRRVALPHQGGRRRRGLRPVQVLRAPGVAELRGGAAPAAPHAEPGRLPDAVRRRQPAAAVQGGVGLRRRQAGRRRGDPARDLRARLGAGARPLSAPRPRHGA